MEYLIIYFSGTGNTRLIAEEIKQRLTECGNSVSLVSIEDEEQIENIELKDKVLGFAFPVYKFTYPDNFAEVIDSVNSLSAGNDYFVFCTYTRFEADAAYDFISALDRHKFRLIGTCSYKAPSCGISARKPKNDYEYESVMFFEDDINKKVDEFAEEILDNQPVKKPRRSPFSNLKKHIVADIEITKYPKLEIKRDICTMCGLCARQCPDNNLTKANNTIEIADDSGCLHCLRCINHCPANAITFGHLTEGDNQFTFKICDELYKKSADGYKEKYWAQFNKVVRKWRRNTLKYWMKNRYRS